MLYIYNLLKIKRKLDIFNFLLFLHDTFCISIDFKAFFMELELGKYNIHEISDFFPLYHYLIPIFTKDFVNQRWCGINLQIFELILFLQIESFLVKLIYFCKRLFLNLILVQDQAKFSIRRIIMSLTEFIFNSIKI